MWQPIGGSGLGVGQQWYNVTASRSSSGVYTNSTGKPIQVSITSSGGCNADIYVNGVSIGLTYSIPGYSMGHAYFVVPHGMTYNLQSCASFVKWVELR